MLEVIKETKIEVSPRLSLINSLQRELIKESGEYREKGDAGAIDWVVKNAQEFRRIFEEIWTSVENDPHYAEAIQMMESGDGHVIKEELLRMIRSRLEERP